MNSKEFHTLEEIIDCFRDNAWIMLAVNRSGVIKNCIPFKALPNDIDKIHSLLNSQKNNGCVGKFYQQDKNMNKDKIKKIINDIVESYAFFDTHSLKLKTNKLDVNLDIKLNKTTGNQDIEIKEDHGPFLICEVTNLPLGAFDNGFISRCFKCGVHVYISERFMLTWYNSGAIVVCSNCSHGQPGQLLETLK